MTTRPAWNWASADTGDFVRRDYASYDAYVQHQAAKLAQMSPQALDQHEARYLQAVRPRLEMAGLPPGTRVICLGARRGTEVQAFLALGCDARGLDLNPGPENPYVDQGDFHALPYPTGSIEVVFTNALDHCYDLRVLLNEIRRVLVLKGQFIVEAVCGTDEGCLPAEYESFAWRTVDALVRAVADHGFVCVRRVPFLCPWPGEHLVFRVAERPC